MLLFDKKSLKKKKKLTLNNFGWKYQQYAININF